MSEDLMKNLIVLKLVRLGQKGFEVRFVVTVKGYEKEALKKQGKGWRLAVKLDRVCPKCKRNFEDWGIYNTKQGFIRLLKCTKCDHTETKETTLDELVEMIKTRMF